MGASTLNAVTVNVRVNNNEEAFCIEAHDAGEWR
jgi:hypothetical protein